jgi:hypothetical protein
MKHKLIAILFVTIGILTGCNKPLGPFATISIAGSHCFMVKTDDPYLPKEMNPYGVENSYTLVWPLKGMMTPEAEKELIRQVFADSIAASVKEASDKWLKNMWLYDDEVKAVSTKPLDKVDNQKQYTYAHLQNSVREDGELVTFTNATETFLAGAAHGAYIVEYFTYDRKKKRVLHLNDLVDTAKMSEIVVRAIKDLTVNKDVLDCMYDEYKTAEKIIVPDNFFIDSTRSTINIVFQQYDITPYACGLQTVVVPIYWLSKHTELTPYAKKLFGKESYIKN